MTSSLSISNKTAVISGIGIWVPEKTITNDDLSKIVDTTDEWITTRTGIRERRIAAPDETCSEMAAKAAENALRNAGAAPDEIDLLVVATITADHSTPSTACLVQPKVGLVNATCFDISAACSGFVFALDIARQYILTGAARKAMVVGAEKMSAILDWQDRSTCVIFGDGAGAVVLEAGSGNSRGVISNCMGSDGTLANLIRVEAGGSTLPASADTVQNRQHFIKMEGNQVFKSAVRGMAEIAEKAVAQAGIAMADVKAVVPHQANVRIISAIADKLALPMDKVVLNLDRYGNTTAASIPLALDEAVRDGRIQDGDFILLVAFGAGLTWGATVVQWGL
ncbi:MAG: beta-ketoacyl-ACP synthase III [Kiritimatiellia bacterium]|jgi:3-oxoacyl-[acyl-carrier-protein] synthase-3